MCNLYKTYEKIEKLILEKQRDKTECQDTVVKDIYFIREMLAEAAAEMGALEMSIDEYSEMSVMESPPDNLIGFASQVKRSNVS